MKKILFLFFVIFAMPAMADMPTVTTRVSVFSTSSDWEAVSGLSLSSHRIKFIPDSKLIKNGLELYYMDGFPCYGQTDRVRGWIGRDGKISRDIQITCLYSPKTLYFAWRNAARDATQDKTTGLLECAASGEYELTVDLSKCTVYDNWSNMGK
jgi:hypothetical protein